MLGSWKKSVSPMRRGLGAGISVSEKLPKNGDFILAFRGPSGASLEPRMLLDSKDKAAVAESDIDKLVRDAKERALSVGILVTREDSQLRQIDQEAWWGRKDGVWILRTTRRYGLLVISMY